MPGGSAPPESGDPRLAHRPNEKTVLRRTARYTLAALGACALMVATANATGRVNGAKVELRTSAQKQRKPGPPTAPKNGRGSAPSRTRGTGSSREAESARWRTGRRRPCGKRCR